MSGQSFTFVDAISAIRARFPAFQFSNNPIHSQPVGKEQTAPGRPRQYVRRTLSYLLVPLIAVAILGEDEARHYFPPLPTTGRGASPATMWVTVASLASTGAAADAFPDPSPTFNWLRSSQALAAEPNA